jgi:hypothetical protein
MKKPLNDNTLRNSMRKDNALGDPVPRGALMIVGVVFVTIMGLWFLVLGVLQARG